MSEPIVNKVAQSGIVTLNLEDFLPGEEIISFDLKNYLFMELILKEKDFREALKNRDWSGFRQKAVALFCSADAIVPAWAYMLVTSYLTEASEVYAGTPEEMRKHLTIKNIRAINTGEYAEQRVVVKGCGDVEIEAYAYAEITRILVPVAKSIMYGEPCSTVPVYKKK